MKKKKKETKQRTKKRDFVFFLRFVRRECANAERQTKKTTAICMCMCVCVRDAMHVFCLHKTGSANKFTGFGLHTRGVCALCADCETTTAT